MSNNINLTVSLKDEDRERLDNLIKALRQFSAPAGTPETAPETLNASESAEPAEAKEIIEEETKTPEPAPEPEAPAQQYAVADVQQKVVALSAAGKKTEVREIVTAYAERVSAIPEDKLDEVMSKLLELEG